MADTRHANVTWDVGESPTYAGATLAVLMDIRDELRQLNTLLRCPKVTGIPAALRTIARNTTRKTRAR